MENLNTRWSITLRYHKVNKYVRLCMDTYVGDNFFIKYISKTPHEHIFREKALKLNSTTK